MYDSVDSLSMINALLLINQSVEDKILVDTKKYCILDFQQPAACMDICTQPIRHRVCVQCRLCGIMV